MNSGSGGWSLRSIGGGNGIAYFGGGPGANSGSPGLEESTGDRPPPPTEILIVLRPQSGSQAPEKKSLIQLVLSSKPPPIETVVEANPGFIAVNEHASLVRDGGMVKLLD